jgi:hypothetical protein
LNVRKAFRPHAARVLIDNRHAAKVKFLTGTDFRTRIHGTDRQIGQKFPVGTGASKALPRVRYGKPLQRARIDATPCEARAFAAEQELIAHGFKGFEIEIKLKSGRYVSIPLIAKDWHEAFAIAHTQMQKYDPEDIDEITIVDPSLSEIAHAISGGAHKLAAGIKRGIEKIPAYARKAKAYGMKGARVLGKIAATPGQMRDLYELEKARRDGAEAPAPAQTEEQILAEATRLKRIGVAGAEPIAAPTPRAEPGLFAGYTAEEWKALRERRAAEAKARQAPITKSEIERRKRVTSKPFQSAVFGSQAESAPLEEEPSTALKKAKRQLRRAQRALQRLG